MTTRNYALARFGAAAAAALLAFSLTVPAFANDTTGGSSEVIGGDLTLTSDDTFDLSDVTLNGQNQTATGDFDIDLKDLTGSGSGWRVGISATPFTFTNGGVTDTLAAGAAYISEVAIVCDDPEGDATQTCRTPTNSVTSFPMSLATEMTLANAAQNTGMGDFTLTPSFNLDLPANAYDGTYQSTITLTVASGPTA
ncbi:MAG: hypothetical protein HGA45_26570 [Chloroflexales bacterium]|nr:hypothetical protein [Chloroflexales bacterium]